MNTRIYVDVETTGLSRGRGAVVVEVGAVVWDGRTEIANYSSLCNPGVAALDIPDAKEALAINGIKREDILAAPLTADVALAFAVFCDEFALGAPMHAFNRAFDSKFLEVAPWEIASTRWGECVMIASQDAMKFFKWPRLNQAAAHFQVAQENAHRALDDARVAAKIHTHILAGRQRV